MENNEFLKELESIGIILSKKQEQQLEKYYELLVETNKHLNLTAITEKNSVYLKHFYDSLTLVKATDLTKKIKICDLGTGAGFPGLVLKIVFPNLEMTLVDSLEKRTKFLKTVIEQLNLTNITVVTDRIEHFSKETIEKFDVLVSRAVAKTNILLELASPALKINGHFYLMKANATDEIKEATNAIKTLNFKLNNLVEFSLPIEQSTRTIIDLEKISKTNPEYPRNFAQIKKRPL